MAQKVVKVKAHKRLDGTGKVESVDAHLRKLEKVAKLNTYQYKMGSNIVEIENKGTHWGLSAKSTDPNVEYVKYGLNYFPTRRNAIKYAKTGPRIEKLKNP